MKEWAKKKKGEKRKSFTLCLTLTVQEEKEIKNCVT